MSFYLNVLRLVGLNLDGKPRYISLKVRFDDFNRIYLSDRVVISENVVFLTHDYSLTTALLAIGRVLETDVAFLKDIKVGSNTFIGLGAIILPGSVIGSNVIVGAGTVVRGYIPDNSIYIGNPGKVVASTTEKAIVWEASLERFDKRID
ncbi:acyltransferase [Shewanella vesiculosa]|uniref:acyltransferase n=1 Tax=Shewanella vesiculosa TaxID=518738 RepID=UPI00384D831C